jgi:hypothetical protein
MKQATIALCLGLGLLAICACSGGAKDSAELRTLPADPPLGQMKRLPAGTYVTGQFEPALTLKVGQGWKLLEERQNYFGLSWQNTRGGDSTIYFINPPAEVYDQSNPEELSPQPAPKDWVGWFRSHPYMVVDKPQPMSVGGVSGKRIDMYVDLLPEEYQSVWCGGGRVVALWPLQDGAWCAIEGTLDRLIILGGVEGKKVIIDVGGPSRTFEEFLPRAQKVLDTVEWKGE